MKREAITEHRFRNDPDAVLRQVEAGRDFMIMREGKPVARISPFPGERRVDVDAKTIADILATPIDSDDLAAELDAAEAPIS